MIITMPSSPNFATVRFTLNRTIAATRSAFTYKQRTQEYDGVYWSAEVTLPPMKRADALEWTTFLTRLQGLKNTFLMADPSHLTNSGTYNQTWLATENRVSDTSETLSFTASSKTITAATSIFTNAFAGDFIVVSGATNDDNNGTFKIVTITDTNNIVVDRDIVDATSQSCTINENKKGITGLNLIKTGSGSGTIKKGDYLAIHDAASSTSNPVQYVLAVEDATVGGQSNNFYGVRIEPKLRADIPNNYYVKFASSKGQFRLASNQTSWSVNEASIYGLAFTAIEVIDG